MSVPRARKNDTAPKKGCLIKNFGKVNSKRITFEEDICAAAKGYEYLANVQLSAGIGL